jgi:outer membrane protein OmpA-like peptidoglycan-associated protein
LGVGSSIKNPILTVGKQLTRRLYVETVYHHNAPPDANEKEGRVRYQVASKWTVDTAFGDAGEGKLGLFWSHSFGGPPAPAPPGDEWLLGGKPVHERDDDGDGIPNAFDLCRRATEDVDGYRDDDGCPDPDNDGDGVVDARDAAPNRAEVKNGVEDEDGVPDEATHRLWGLRTRLAPIPFATGGAQIPRVATARLEALVRIMELLPEVQVTVTGHSDNVGAARTRLRVSQRRAEAVARFLRRRGIATSRIRTLAVGAQAPLDRKDTDEARARNRRVGVAVSLPSGANVDAARPTTPRPRRR